MKSLNGMLADAYASWLSSVARCCSAVDDSPRRSLSEKPSFYVVRDQPGLVAPPATEPQRPATRASGKAPRKSFASARSSFSRRRLLSNASSRRPQISAPSNFRHLQSDSFQFPGQVPPPPPRGRPTSFRPLELSIYLSDRELSPILPHFEFPGLTPPPAAKIHESRTRDDDGFTLGHERSYSSMSFHLPRRSPSTNTAESTTPRPPPKGRGRAYTSPNVDMIVERIASAMIEVERLQHEIDDVVERQSIYLGSRPSTAHSMRSTMTRTLADMEPMPSLPALPPVAPSFAERLNSPVTATFDRPNTAPSRAPVHIPHRAKTFTEASAPFHTIHMMTPPSSRPRTGDRPPPPPLPLVLRPPLRKKKSFSRVSSWLGNQNGQSSGSHVSHDSITNLPRPVKGGEGFYQTVASPEGSDRASFDTVSTVTTWRTEDEEERTMPTTWSPGSTPATKSPGGGVATSKQGESPLERSATFGRTALNPRRESVGVAF